MIGYFLSKAPYQEEFKEIFFKYFPYTMSNLAYLRAIAQYFSFIFMSKCNHFLLFGIKYTFIL